MRLVFLGTRGYIEVRNRYHRRHSSLLISSKSHRIMIDCGEDWLRSIANIAPQAIFVTHAHPDHCGGLRDGVDCPVYATAAAWDGMSAYKIERRHIIAIRNPLVVHGIRFEAFPVIHSLRAPAVGYRITAGPAAIFYVPDVIDINDRMQALRGQGCLSVTAPQWCDPWCVGTVGSFSVTPPSAHNSVGVRRRAWSRLSSRIAAAKS